MSERERRNYQILNTIATGGTAVLYKAIQTSLDRPVVIKRLHAHLISDPSFTRRFELEAKAAASLDHENIVRIIDFGSANNNYYIVMEYIDGPSLKEILETRQVLGEDLSLLIAREICMGLDHAHQRGIIHRDIKPGNIMITNEGQVKITDFGLAKLHQNQLQQTLATTLVGTPLYMSPEQAIGESVDCRSDLFSLGTICYEAMTGKQPFLGDNYAAVLQRIISGNVPPLSRLMKETSPEVEAIVMKALAREPGKRFRTAAEMARAIEIYLGQERILSVHERLRRLVVGGGEIAGARGAASPDTSRKKRRTVAVTAALVALGATVLAVTLNPALSGRLGSWIEALRRAHPAAPSKEILTGEQGEVPSGISFNPIEEPQRAAIDTVAEAESTAAAPDEEKSEEQPADSASVGPENPAPQPSVPAEERTSQPPEEQPAVPVTSGTQPKETETRPAIAPPGRAESPQPSRDREIRESTGYLTITVDPPSEIVIDGRTRAVGDHLATLELLAGPHEVVCRSEGYKDYSESITIRRGELSKRSVSLEAVTGGIAIQAAYGAQVFVDGSLKGCTPLTSPIQIPAGTHEVELRKVGFRTWRNAVYVPPNETLRLNIALIPQ